MIEELVDNREQRVSHWKAGTRLQDAWVTYGDDRQKRLLRGVRGTPAVQAHAQLIMADLFDQIADGKIVAIGFRIEPKLSDGPVFIPPDIFSEFSQDTWGDGRISASGWAYERVRLLPPDKLSKELDNIEEKSSFAHASNHEQKSGITLSPKFGRRNTYELCYFVFEHMRTQSPSMLMLSAEKLEPGFRVIYDQIHKDAASETPAPQARTLRDHLKRYRSATMGKNWQE